MQRAEQGQRDERRAAREEEREQRARRAQGVGAPAGVGRGLAQGGSGAAQRGDLARGGAHVVVPPTVAISAALPVRAPT